LKQHETMPCTAVVRQTGWLVTPMSETSEVTRSRLKSRRNPTTPVARHHAGTPCRARASGLVVELTDPNNRGRDRTTRISQGARQAPTFGQHAAFDPARRRRLRQERNGADRARPRGPYEARPPGHAGWRTASPVHGFPLPDWQAANAQSGPDLLTHSLESSLWVWSSASRRAGGTWMRVTRLPVSRRVLPPAGLPAPWLLGPRSSSPHLARGRAPARTATRTSLAFTDTSHAGVMITTAEPRR